jgi:uncharacterized tellurite resistance protein B-like protein
MNWLLNDFADKLFIPEDVQDLFVHYDYRHGALETLLPHVEFDTPADIGRIILYDSVRMARADSFFAPEERRFVLQAAKLLHVSSQVANAIAGIVEAEEALERTRHALFVSADTPRRADGGRPNPTGKIPQLPKGIERKQSAIFYFCCALMVISGADGQVSRAEERWLLDVFARSEKLDPQLIDLLRSFEYRAVRLEELMPFIQTDYMASEALLYTGIKMSRADTVYHSAERRYVHRAAELLGVPMDIAMTLEGLVDTEEHLEKARKHLFGLRPL